MQTGNCLSAHHSSSVNLGVQGKYVQSIIPKVTGIFEYLYLFSGLILTNLSWKLHGKLKGCLLSNETSSETSALRFITSFLPQCVYLQVNVKQNEQANWRLIESKKKAIKNIPAFWKRFVVASFVSCLYCLESITNAQRLYFNYFYLNLIGADNVVYIFCGCRSFQETSQISLFRFR